MDNSCQEKYCLCQDSYLKLVTIYMISFEIIKYIADSQICILFFSSNKHYLNNYIIGRIQEKLKYIWSKKEKGNLNILDKLYHQ